MMGECPDVLSMRTAMVDQHECLPVMHAGGSLAITFEPGRLDQPAGGKLDPAITRRLSRSRWALGTTLLSLERPREVRQ